MKSYQERRAEELATPVGEHKTSFIFLASIILSAFLVLNGVLYLIIFDMPLPLLCGLLSLVIGTAQLIVDFGWMWILKINRSGIENITEAFFLLGNIRSQKIFLIPLIIDITVVLIPPIFIIQ